MNRYGRGGYGGDDPWNNAMRGVSFLGDAMRTGQQIGETRYQQDERDNENKAYEYIAGKLGSTGDLSQLDGDPIMNTRHGATATGKFMLNRANTEQSRLSMLKNMAAADDHFYKNTFKPMAFAAQEAFKSGNMQAFGKIAGELSAASPFPYKYDMGEDGNFVEHFRSSKEGKFVDTGTRMTPQQVFEQLNGIMSGEQRVLAGANMEVQDVNQRFLATSARFRMGTILDNANNLADPKNWIPLTKGGKTVYAIPQNRHDDYSVAPAYRLVDDSGGMGGMVENLDGLLSQGFVRSDVKAKIETAQRIAAGRGAGRGGGGEGAPAGQAGQFNLTDGDRSWISKVSTIKDDITGNEKYDAYTGMALETLMGQKGLSRSAAFLAFDRAVNQAMTVAQKNNPNVPPEQLKVAARQYVCQQIATGGQEAQQTAQQAAMPQEVPQSQSESKPESGGRLTNTLRDVASGSEGTGGSSITTPDFKSVLQTTPNGVPGSNAVSPPKESVWRKFPREYAEYVRLFGERPDRLKPAQAIYRLEQAQREEADSKAQSGAAQSSGAWSADMNGLHQGMSGFGGAFQDVKGMLKGSDQMMRGYNPYKGQ